MTETHLQRNSEILRVGFDVVLLSSNRGQTKVGKLSVDTRGVAEHMPELGRANKLRHLGAEM